MKKYEIWIADLNPQLGTETGKIRPVVIVQGNLLNGIHSSTLISPLNTNIRYGVTILRIHLRAGIAGLTQDSDIMIDKLSAIDNRRLRHKIGILDIALRRQLDENIKTILDLI